MIDENLIIKKMDECQMKALDALARYKFWMFGYHAAAWVKYNQLLPDDFRLENPFYRLVQEAKSMQIDPQKAQPVGRQFRARIVPPIVTKPGGTEPGTRNSVRLP